MKAEYMCGDYINFILLSFMLDFFSFILSFIFARKDDAAKVLLFYSAVFIDILTFFQISFLLHVKEWNENAFRCTFMLVLKITSN